MSASNYTWICFDCRAALRQPKTEERVPRCPQCSDELFCLGYKVEIPKKSDVRGWRELRGNCHNRALTAADDRAVARVRERHDAEREIAKLRALPPNKDRSKLIAELRKRIIRLA